MQNYGIPSSAILKPKTNEQRIEKETPAIYSEWDEVNAGSCHCAVHTDPITLCFFRRLDGGQWRRFAADWFGLMRYHMIHNVHSRCLDCLPYWYVASVCVGATVPLALASREREFAIGSGGRSERFEFEDSILIGTFMYIYSLRFSSYIHAITIILLEVKARSVVVSSRWNCSPKLLTRYKVF